MDERGSSRDGEIDRICCLCGDVGFADDLLRCPRCRYRLQHSYCSRFYPAKIDMESWGCEWCIHQQNQNQNQNQQQQHQEEDERAPTPRKINRTGGGGGGHGGTNSMGTRKSSAKAVDRWKRLARAAKMGSGRRYKLLADVLCS